MPFGSVAESKSLSFSSQPTFVQVQQLPGNAKIVTVKEREQIRGASRVQFQTSVDLISADRQVLRISESNIISLLYVKSSNEEFMNSLTPFVVITFNKPPSKFLNSSETFTIRITITPTEQILYRYEGELDIKFRVINLIIHHSHFRLAPKRKNEK